MPLPKTLAAAATTSKTCFIELPRIIGSCNYRAFLHALLNEKHNKKVLALAEKDVVDKCFRLQAKQQFQLDNAKLKRAMAEPDRGESIATWNRWKTRLRTAMPKALIAKTAEDLKGLSLPALAAANQGTENRDMWKEITYEHFVGQLQRKNPDAVLTKAAADSAFRLVADRLNSINQGRHSAIARVLGKESTRYWKDR